MEHSGRGQKTSGRPQPLQMVFQDICLLNAVSQISPEQPVDKTKSVTCLVMERERQRLIYGDFEACFKAGKRMRQGLGELGLRLSKDHDLIV